VEDDDDDDEDERDTKATGEGGKAAKSGIGRRKINIEFIEDKGRRHITFSKRKAGIMKKAYELSTLTGTQVLLLVASETGHVYTFSTPKLQPMITKPEGKNLIQACLNAPDNPHSPPHRIAYQEAPPASNNLVPFQPGNSTDSLNTSYDDYDKDEKDRRGRLSVSDKSVAPPPYSSLEASMSHHLGAPVNPSLGGGYPSGPYPLPSSLNHLMSSQYQQQQQAQAQQQQQQQQSVYSASLAAHGAIHPPNRYMSQQSAGASGGSGGPAQQSQYSTPQPQYSGAYASPLLSQYQSQGYHATPYWASNNANPNASSEKLISESNNSNSNNNNSNNESSSSSSGGGSSGSAPNSTSSTHST